MEIILIPGLWLDGSSWERVSPRLEEAGHRPHPVTLPGMESRDANRAAVTRADQVGAVVAMIDAVEGPVVVVGHSAGADVGHAAVDARPDRVVHAIYIGGFPGGDGDTMTGFEAQDGEVPLPEWSEMDEADLVDLDEDALAEFRQRAIPSPERALTDPQRLTDERRYQVPVTMICPEFTADMLKSWMDQGLDPVLELTRVRDVTFVDLPTGHWPQFTRPEELAAAILEALGG
jgi:pimeloyl-ACP methyl ester carboxylesterase